jgi:hypothetical protein
MKIKNIRNVKRMKTKNVNIMYVGRRTEKKSHKGPSLLVVIFVSSTTPWFRTFFGFNSS